MLALACGKDPDPASERGIEVQIVLPEVLERKPTRVERFLKMGRVGRFSVHSKKKRLCEHWLTFPREPGAVIPGCRGLSSKKPTEVRLEIWTDKKGEVKGAKVLAEGKAQVTEEQNREGAVVVLKLKLKVPVKNLDD